MGAIREPLARGRGLGQRPPEKSNGASRVDTSIDLLPLEIGVRALVLGVVIADLGGDSVAHLAGHPPGKLRETPPPPDNTALGALTRLGHVVVDEKLAEQHEVAEVHCEAQNRICFIHVALVALVLVHDGLDGHEHADQHLRQLRERDEDGERRDVLAVPRRHDREIAVHHGMHGVVHGCEPQSCGDAHAVGMPAIKEHCGVVPPLQRDHGLLGKQQQDRVDELRNLGIYEKGHKQPAPTTAIP
mmetsp:Transcript_19268/g.57670  ORF Transcript_19268/g.57670 Transcript_19268/m.57670 type:complete len:244 (-) Transcript_19268:604-1335(-)